MERRFGQGDHAILGPFAAMDVNQHAIGIDVVDMKMESFLEPESQGVDDEEEAMHGGLFYQLEKSVNFTDGDDDGDLELSAGSYELESVPVSRAGESKELLEGLLSDVDGASRPVSIVLDEE